MKFIKAVFDISYLSMVTVLDDVSTTQNEPVFGKTNLLYDSVAIPSAAELVISGQRMYTYCPA